jgi:hypothetical protein
LGFLLISHQFNQLLDVFGILGLDYKLGAQLEHRSVMAIEVERRRRVIYLAFEAVLLQAIAYFVHHLSLSALPP